MDLISFIIWIVSSCLFGLKDETNFIELLFATIKDIFNGGFPILFSMEFSIPLPLPTINDSGELELQTYLLQCNNNDSTFIIVWNAIFYALFMVSVAWKVAKWYEWSEKWWKKRLDYRRVKAGAAKRKWLRIKNSEINGK